MKKILAMLVAVILAGAVVIAGTIDATVGGAYVPSAGVGKVYVIENTWDQLVHPTTNDTIQVLDIPEDTLIVGLTWEVINTNSAATDFSIGFGTTLGTFATNLASETAAHTACTNRWTPKLFTTADTIDISPEGAMTIGSIRLRAICADVSK